MKQKYFSHSVILIALAVLSFGANVRAQEPEEKRIGKLTATPSAVNWTVPATNAGSTLIVAAPDGRIFRKEFRPGESPEFALNEINREGLPDGTYIYELRIKPVVSAAMKEKLRAERGSDDESEEGRNARKRSSVETLTESGSFAVVNGQPIVAGGMEPQRRLNTARARVAPPELMYSRHAAALRHHVNMRPDEVIPDDLIVQGSACVGLDCVTGESFGQVTIKLKENNLRLQFDDTSISTGYSANDWQLTANDTSSGGASKFSIEDITAAKVPLTITAAAPDNSIFVASDGKVGFRTAVPALDLHMSTSNTPAVRFEQTSGGGYTAQTWDIGANEANFFVRDLTSLSKLPFRIRPGAPTSSIDIDADGNVGIGNSSPDLRLDVEVPNATTDFTNTLTYATGIGNVSQKKVVLGYDETGQDIGLIQSVHIGTGFKNLAINPNGGNVGIGTTAPTDALSVSGNASKSSGGTSWAVFSDERLKNIKGRFSPGLKAVMQLQPLRFEYKQDNALGLKAQGEQIGFGAQSLQKVIPEAVTRNSNGYLMVNSDPILWTMLNAIQEQQKQIEDLKAEVEKLRTASRSRKN